MKRIVSLNANGLRSAIQKGLQDWISENQFDMICFQETKMDSSHADPDYFKTLGYYLNTRFSFEAKSSSISL